MPLRVRPLRRFPALATNVFMDVSYTFLHDLLGELGFDLSLSDRVQPVGCLHDTAAQDVHLAGIADNFCPGPDPLFALFD